MCNDRHLLDWERVFDSQFSPHCFKFDCQLAVKSNKVLTLLNFVDRLEAKSNVFNGSWNVVEVKAILLMFSLFLSKVRIEGETFV